MADYRKIIPFIKQKEGGLSRSKYDTAKKHPAPCRYKGKTGWHTNKGITWQTFSSNKDLGYKVSCKNFILMPDEIWNKIFKRKYWDKFYLDSLNSQPIADYIVSFAWGFGVYGASTRLKKFFKKEYGKDIESRKEMINYINTITKTKKSEQRLFDKLIEYKRKSFISLNQPSNIKGWLNRLDEFKGMYLDFWNKKGVKTTTFVIGALLLTATITTIIIVSKNSK